MLAYHPAGCRCDDCRTMRRFHNLAAVAVLSMMLWGLGLLTMFRYREVSIALDILAFTLECSALIIMMGMTIGRWLDRG